jgi:hypothetical protein
MFPRHEDIFDFFLFDGGHVQHELLVHRRQLPDFNRHFRKRRHALSMEKNIQDFFGRPLQRKNDGRKNAVRTKQDLSSGHHDARRMT